MDNLKNPVAGFGPGILALAIAEPLAENKKNR
jgi:hypothetical protein